MLFDEWGTVHLVDFDTAVSLDDREISDISNRKVIAYMAPEATLGVRLDERADLYSLGATIYEMCSGSPPNAGSWDEILASRRDGSPAPIEREDLPEGLRELTPGPPCHRPRSAAAAGAKCYRSPGGSSCGNGGAWTAPVQR